MSWQPFGLPHCPWLAWPQPGFPLAEANRSLLSRAVFPSPLNVPLTPVAQSRILRSLGISNTICCRCGVKGEGWGGGGCKVLFCSILLLQGKKLPSAPSFPPGCEERADTSQEFCREGRSPVHGGLATDLGSFGVGEWNSIRT